MPSSAVSYEILQMVHHHDGFEANICDDVHHEHVFDLDSLSHSARSFVCSKLADLDASIAMECDSSEVFSTFKTKFVSKIVGPQDKEYDSDADSAGLGVQGYYYRLS